MPDRFQPRRGGSSGLAGGSLLAFSLIAGAVAGTLLGQPSIGFLAGLAVGIALYLLVWFLGRRR